MSEAAGLEQRAGDDVAECEERDGGRNDEERDLSQPRVEPPCEEFRALPAVPATPDIAGSSAADTDIPNRLTGSVVEEQRVGHARRRAPVGSSSTAADRCRR